MEPDVWKDSHLEVMGERGEKSWRDSEEAPGSSCWLIYEGTCGNSDRDGRDRACVV